VGPNDDLCVPVGICGLGVPLPPTGSEAEAVERIGAIIAHALLSPEYWGNCTRLHKDIRCFEQGYANRRTCFASLLSENENHGARPSADPRVVEHDKTISVSVRSRSSSRPWNVEVCCPASFHMLRQLVFGDDLIFCDMLRSSSPMVAKGGKSNAGFWKSIGGEIILKEVKPGESQALEGTLAERLLKKTFENAKNDNPTSICEIFGVYKVSGPRLSVKTIIVMRNLRYGCNNQATHLEFFDIKGLGEHRSVDGNKTDGSNAENKGDAESPEVRWDRGFLRKLGQLAGNLQQSYPLSLRQQDYASLRKALDEDTQLLEELGLVDYSMFVALQLPSDRPSSSEQPDRPGSNECPKVRLGIIDYLQCYTLSKQAESNFKQLYKKTEATTILEPSLYRRRFRDFFLDRAFENACID